MSIGEDPDRPAETRDTGDPEDDRATPVLVEWELSKIHSSYIDDKAGQYCTSGGVDHWPAAPDVEKLSIIYATTRIGELGPPEALRIVEREVDLSRVSEADQVRHLGFMYAEHREIDSVRAVSPDLEMPEPEI